MPRHYLYLIPIVFVAAALISAGCAAPQISKEPALQQDNPGAALAAAYPAPGELVAVDGSRMHIRCEGTGSPAVILEAGSTDCSLSWARVQPEIAAFTKVCSYDRLGYGWSDPLAGPLTTRAVTGRLNTLLANANISPPYILAGHSLGGEYVRAYAHRYPSEIAGLVLVDPGSEWQMVRTGENFTREQQAATAAAVTGLRAGRAKAADGTFLRNLTLVPIDPRLPDYEFHAYQALLATRPHFWEARATEGESAFAIFTELQRENISSPGSMPVVVIASGNEMGFSADPKQNAYANRVFRALQQEMAQGSRYGNYSVAPGTSHYVQLDRPDIVIDAIRTMVNATRLTG
jgi:pimeloyl-ACP methyl ester carboxylesterase